MRVRLVFGIALPLVIVSAPAMAFGLLGIVATVASAAVGAAGGAALSSGGVAPAGRSGAIASASAPEGKLASRIARTTVDSEFASLAPSRRGDTPPYAAQTNEFGWVNGSPRVLAGLGKSLPSQPGASRRTLRLCRNAVARELAPHGAVRVEIASAGRAVRSGTTTAVPILARVIYRHAAGHEVSQARMACQLTKSGVRLTAR